MLDLEKDIDKMTEEYDNFVEAIEIYTEKPTNKNKKKVIEKHKIFGLTKGKIMAKVRNYIMY